MASSLVLLDVRVSPHSLREVKHLGVGKFELNGNKPVQVERVNHRKPMAVFSRTQAHSNDGGRW